MVRCRFAIGNWRSGDTRARGKRWGMRNVFHTPSDAASILTAEAQGRRIFILRLVCWLSKVKQLIQHHTAND